MFTGDVLPKWERIAYWIIGLGGIVNGLYRLHVEGDEYKGALMHLEPGWSWLNREKDTSDFEWETYCQYFRTGMIMNLIHVLLSQMCRVSSVKAKMRVYILTVFDLMAINYLYGVRIFLFLLTKSIIMYCMSLTSSRFIVWLTGLIFTVFDYHPKISFYQERYLHLNNYDGTALRFSVASCFFDLSLISFALEKICRNSLHHQTRSLTQIDKVLTTTPEQPRTLENNVLILLDCIFYAFHLPKFITGPFYSFRKFYPEVMDYFNALDNRVDILDVVKNLMRCMFWGVFMELQFHYFYSDGLGHSVYALERMSLAAVVSVGYWHGQCFTVKYVFFYGVSGQLLRFDGITPYANPRCISWIYSYADMWRYFDVGLYQFVKDYIYVPLGGSQSGFLRHTISSLASFFFIYIWHGGRQNLFYWCLGSFIAVTLETFGRYLKRSRLVIDARSRLSPAMQLRLEAILNYPVYLVSCWSAFFFFFGIKTTRVIIRRMILGPWHIMILEMLVFISAVHNAYYIGLVRQCGQKSNK
ncbi:hypothetical protein Btru_048880 [Bulinus truncatus]|nr:hypothetical protein Btru_048880 [Bulinus truncatus]